MGLVENVSGRLPTGGEFQGYTGDCAEYAYMVANAAVDPQAPCSRDELNRLATEAIQGGQAGSQGQMTDGNLAWLCRHEGAAFTQIPFDLSGLFYWLGQGDAVCVGFQNGQALPGNEPNVFGHCVAFLAHDGAGFTIANGDSVNGRAGQLDTGVLTQAVQAAQPTTMTVILPSSTVNVAEIMAAAQTILAEAQAIEAAAKGQ